MTSLPKQATRPVDQEECGLHFLFLSRVATSSSAELDLPSTLFAVTAPGTWPGDGLINSCFSILQKPASARVDASRIAECRPRRRE